MSANGWHALFATHPQVARTTVVAQWAANRWPLIRRRGIDGAPGVPLGLPLPPSAGKRRLDLVVSPAHIDSVSPPPALAEVVRFAPPTWRSTCDRLAELASQRALEIRTFGSVAWQAVTGLDYLTDRSDLDLLVYIDCRTDIARLTVDLASIETKAPMRLDGELIREDGVAVNWREFHLGPREILVKTASGVALLETSRFLSGNVTP